MYRAVLGYTLVVEAESEIKAQQEAAYYVREQLSDYDLALVKEVETLEDVPSEWHLAIPFGADDKDQRTVWERVQKS